MTAAILHFGLNVGHHKFLFRSSYPKYRPMVEPPDLITHQQQELLNNVNVSIMIIHGMNHGLLSW